MSGLVCPHCGKTVDLFKAGGGEELAAEVGVPFLGRIPLDPRVVASGDAGTPLLLSLPDTPVAESVLAAFTPLLDRIRTRGSISPTQHVKETQTMKIAIPMADGRLCMHFGHCEQFALVEVDDSGNPRVAYLTPPAHEPGVLPRWLHQQGADIIIAGGMGQRAQSLFSRNGIKVVVGAPAASAEDTVSAYLAGTLKTGANVCDH
jgi:predicted Fe-Mo cluster-binding NifX family protein